MAIEIKGKEYVVRELWFEDTERLSVIIDKIGVDHTKLESIFKEIKAKLTKKALLEKKDEELSDNVLEDIGYQVLIKVLLQVVRNYNKVYAEVKEFFASLIGVDPEEFAKMPIVTPLRLIKELSKDNDLANFLEQAAG